MILLMFFGLDGCSAQSANQNIQHVAGAQNNAHADGEVSLASTLESYTKSVDVGCPYTALGVQGRYHGVDTA